MDAELIVIGSGAAGLVAALTAAPHAEVLLVTDRTVGRSNTAMAQGGLQLPEAEAASRDTFVADMLASARVAVDEARVWRFADAVGETVDQLVDWGLALQRDAAGQPVRRIAGGMSAPRVVNTTTLIGPALIKLLRQELGQRSVTVVDRSPVRRIVPEDGRIALELDGRRLRAPKVICCSGGVSWREAARRGHPTSNPRNHNHELYDHLVDLGLPRVTPDAFQYHPFGRVETVREGMGRCVPESINGFPVRLLDRHGDEVSPVRQDRYALTQAMLQAAEAGRAVDGPEGQPGFWLTLSELPEAEVREAFPQLVASLTSKGGLRDVLVFPFLHYQLGGFAVDGAGRTRVPGLWLAGEMVGGMHGLNRLMGNGLTDSLVHGRIAGRAAAGLCRDERH